MNNSALWSMILEVRSIVAQSCRGPQKIINRPKVGKWHPHLTLIVRGQGLSDGEGPPPLKNGPGRGFVVGGKAGYSLAAQPSVPHRRRRVSNGVGCPSTGRAQVPRMLLGDCLKGSVPGIWGHAGTECNLSRSILLFLCILINSFYIRKL